MPFAAEDDLLLEEITRACFEYFWKEAHPESGLIRDKTRTNVCSAASVGFGLAAFPIAVERGYVSKAEAYARTINILKALKDSDAHRNGVFAHFLDMSSGKTTTKGYETSVSTIDSALLMAGVITAGQYFGGHGKQLADELFARINWASFVNPDNGQVYLSWTPDVPGQMNGSGRFSSHTWDWYTDELLLVVLLGQSAPNPEYRLKPDTMTNWKRQTGSYKGEPYIVSWPGTFFTYTFAHCFYDFAGMGPDILGVDWFENSQRAAVANRDWCRDNADKYSTYGQNRWGITAGSAPSGRYVVPGHDPRGKKGKSRHDSSLHPYGAAMAMPFIPDDAMAALREMRYLEIDGKSTWSDIEQGGYGFWDGFNIDEKWVSNEVIGIAQGPMVLMVENARTGLIWKSFMSSECIQMGIKRAGFDISFNKDVD